jgi:hypothetical protein
MEPIDDLVALDSTRRRPWFRLWPPCTPVYVTNSMAGVCTRYSDSWMMASCGDSDGVPRRLTDRPLEDTAEAAVPPGRMPTAPPPVGMRPVPPRLLLEVPGGITSGPAEPGGAPLAEASPRRLGGGCEAPVGGREPSLVLGQASRAESTCPSKWESVCIFLSSSSSCSAFVRPPTARTLASDKTPCLLEDAMCWFVAAPLGERRRVRVDPRSNMRCHGCAEFSNRPRKMGCYRKTAAHGLQVHSPV